MENVSKMLLIAATVLISTILISLGIKIFNSQSDSTKAASIVGKEISLATSDTADVIAGYSVKRYEDTGVKFTNQSGYYIDYFTGIEIVENLTYTISFDYTIEEKETPNISCGIGMGLDNSKGYNKDFIYQQKYPSQEIGKKNTFTFILKPNNYRNYRWAKKRYSKIYLSLRLARTDPASKFKVRIENIKIKYKAD